MPIDQRFPVLLAVSVCLLAAGCEPEEGVLRQAEVGVPTDADVDGAADMADIPTPDTTAPDLTIADAAPRDARPIDALPTDALPTDATPDGPSDAQPVDAAPDRGVMRHESCARWDDVADDALVAALHETLSTTYRPIEADVDLGGNLNRYTTARYRMFSEVEWFEDPDRGGGHECAYTGRFFQSAQEIEPDDDIINCEHTWPRARMSPRGSLRYSHEQSDIHHLLPTVNGVNSLRGSDRFGNVDQGRNLDFLPAVSGLSAQGEVVFQPRRERRGDVARVIFYFSIRWGGDIRDDEEAALRGWMADDPVDGRERARNDRIEVIQGNRNPFIDCPELVERVEDFASFDALDTDETLPSP